MTDEELERLYMDIYDNGIFEYDYKEKFKRYVNNRLENLEKENAELKEQLGDVKMQKAGEKSDLVWKLMKRKDELEKENAELKEQNIKAIEIIKILKDDLSMYSGAYQKEIAEAEQFLKEE